ncbi:MAG TPA: hypothetical protein VHT91_09855 [Kofleriaceae bacterium]|nr:hypothetical protein [Kofleriaceae bacterium]
MIVRRHSEFVVRLGSPLGSIDELRAALEADTPDCERPVVWTNAADRWPYEIALPHRSEKH